MAKIFPKSGAFDAYDAVGRGSGGAWNGQQEPSSTRLQIVSFSSSGLPSMPSAWGVSRTSVGRCEWIVGDPAVASGGNSNISRSEWVASSNVVNSPGNSTTLENDEWWVAWETYFHPTASTFKSGATWNDFMQVHQAAGHGVGMFTVGINDSGSTPQFKFKRVTGTLSSAGAQLHNFGNFTTGWHRFMFHIIWNSGGSGLTEVWLDDFSGPPDVSISGDNLFSDDRNGFYLKQGWYSSRLPRNQLLWFGGMRIGNTRSEVTSETGGGGGPTGPGAQTGPDGASDIYGNRDIGASSVWNGFSQDTERGLRRTTTADKDFTHVKFYADGNNGQGTGTQTFRGIVRNSSTGVILGQTGTTTIATGAAAAWKSMAFANPVRVLSGTPIQVNVHSSTPTQVARYGCDVLASALYYRSDTFADGADDPATTWSQDDLEPAFYVLHQDPPGGGAPPDEDDTGGGATEATTVTISSFTVSGSNKVLYCAVALRNNSSQTVSGVTWNTSENLTKIAEQSNGTATRVEVWRLINPTSATANIVATLSASAQVVASAISFTGVHQTTPEGTIVKNTGANGVPSSTVTDSSTGEIVLDAVALDWAASHTLTVGQSQTQIAQNNNNDSSTGVFGAMSRSAGQTGPIVMDWSESVPSGTAPAFRAVASAATAGSGNISISKPSGTLDNDIMILTVCSHDNVVLSLPTGWTVIDQRNHGAAFRITTAWKRASSEGSSYTITHTGGSLIIGTIASYSGCITSGSPIDTFSTALGTGGTVTASTITPSVNNCRILFLAFEDDDESHSGWSGTNPTFTERFDYNLSDGQDLRIAGADGSQTTAAATGSRIVTTNAPSSVEHAAMLIALKPPPSSNQEWAHVAFSVREVVAAPTDSVAPQFVSASVNSTSMVLVYNENLDTGSVPATGAFSVTADSSSISVSNVAISTNRVTLTLASPVTAGQAVALTYTPGANPIQDIAGNDAASLSIAADNTTTPVIVDTPDTTAPTLSSAVGNYDEIVLTYSENLDRNSDPNTSDFTVTVAGAAGGSEVFSAIDIDTGDTREDNQVLINLSKPLKSGQTVTLTYTPGTSPIRDVAGNNAAAFSEQVVTNNTPGRRALLLRPASPETLDLEAL